MDEENKTPSPNDENLEEKPTEGIVSIPIEDEMKASYIDYAMSVIVSRALPDARDGLKPVHRRILHVMNDLGLQHNKSYKKCARIVGDTLGKFHPHGDTAVYDALVRMAQDFSLRYPLVQGQGNFGSIDGDRAAAMRYTEARLKKIAEQMLQDIDKDTVNFADNFDGSLKEPVVLPAKIPNLLVNGSSGIAVGMATNIPPHNLREIGSAVIATVKNPEISAQEVTELVSAPDFPTGGIIQGTAGTKQAYAHGKGIVKVRARTELEEKKDRKSIIVTEIPYMVNKTILLEQIADNVRNKVIQGISDLRDESDKDGMRIVIMLKRDASEDVVLNQLFKYTRMQTTFGVNLLALVDNQPKVLNLKQIIDVFVNHRIEVVTRRTQYELKKAEERAHILKGLIIALDNIDEAVNLIKAATSVEQARTSLIAKYSIDEIQANAILDMKLQKLTSLEQDKLRTEYNELVEKIKKLKEILENEQLVRNIIVDETQEIVDTYGDERKTTIEQVEDDNDIDIEELIEEQDMVVTITHSGYIKRIPLETYRSQGRGGKGIKGTGTKDEDFVEHLFVASTHDYVLFFTDDGIVHWLKVYKIPEASRQARGKAIINLLSLPQGRKVSAFVKVREFDDKHNLIFATEKGIVKKTELSAYSRPRQGGIRAINLDEGDSLVNVEMTNGDNKIILATRNGNAVKFHESNARPMGRVSRGVTGIRLRGDDHVIGMVIADDQKTLLTVTEKGYGKRTIIEDYRLINRGGSGVINIKVTDKNGKVVAIKCTNEEDDIMLISQHGIIIRLAVKNISTIGRNTQGVRLMRVGDGDSVGAVAKIVSEE